MAFFIAGVTDAGKGLMLDPLVEVFGRQHVDFCPALGATIALSSLATGDRMRLMYWDEYSPTELASRPAGTPTICGDLQEVACQSVFAPPSATTP